MAVMKFRPKIASDNSKLTLIDVKDYITNKMSDDELEVFLTQVYRFSHDRTYNWRSEGWLSDRRLCIGWLFDTKARGHTIAKWDEENQLLEVEDRYVYP